MHVQGADRADLLVIRKLLLQDFPVAHGNALIITSGKKWFIAVDDEGALVGYAAVQRCGRQAKMVVCRSYKTGAQALLIAARLAQARRWECEYASTYTVEENDRSIANLKAAGFEETQRGGGCIWWQKWLG